MWSFRVKMKHWPVQSSFRCWKMGRARRGWLQRTSWKQTQLWHERLLSRSEVWEPRSQATRLATTTAPSRNHGFNQHRCRSSTSSSSHFSQSCYPTLSHTTSLLVISTISYTTIFIFSSATAHLAKQSSTNIFSLQVF